MLRKVLWTTSMLAAPLFAATREVAYTGGVQTGVVHLKGTRTVPGASLPDTLVFDGGPRVAVFLEGTSPTGCGFNTLGYWFFLQSPGRIGIRTSLDTTWTTATTFPTTALSLDTARQQQYLPGVFLPPNLPTPMGGIKVGEQRTDEICVSHEFVPKTGFKRVVYFSWVKSGQTRYGKIMARNFGIYTSTDAIITHPTVHLDSVEVAYTLFDSTHLDPTPMSLRSAPAKNRAGVNLVWNEREGVRLRDSQGRLYNLHGRRVPEAPTR